MQFDDGFWQRVEDCKAALNGAYRARCRAFGRSGDPASWEGQPERGGVILISEGAPRGEEYLALASPVGRAAELICRGIYRVATAEEIERLRGVDGVHDFTSFEKVAA